MSNITHVVLTGGVGSRLWPLSRKSKPKQYLEIFAGKSLFEKTIKRNLHLVNKTIVVGNDENNELSFKIMSKLNLDFINISEATPRNTAAAIAFAAFSSNPNDLLIVTPSDHIIEGESSYKEAIKKALDYAKDDFLVTFGVKPNKPEIGYGYIEFNGDDVKSFREKPDLATANFFFKSGNFLWNSGIFCFKAGFYLSELKKYSNDVYKSSKIAWENNKRGNLDFELSMKIPSISIDYAVMEKSERIKVVPTNFVWSDLGSFDSVYDYLKTIDYPVDQNGNMIIGTNIYTAFAGLKNCIFVSTDDANLILSKEASQNVKEIYNELALTNESLIS